MKITFCTILLIFSSALFAQENISYQKPPKAILDLVDYERAPSVLMDTKKEYMLLSYRNTYKSLDDLSQDDMRLGGLRINPKTNIGSTVTYINNLKIQKIGETNARQVQGLPTNPQIANVAWSADEKKIAFSNTTATGVELWVLDVASAQAKKLTESISNANAGNPFSWFIDNKHILVRKLKDDRAPLQDNKTELPTGPIVSNSVGQKSQNRTYQDLLKNKLDEANFENLITSELLKVALDGTSKVFLPAGMYVNETFSPDGNYLLVTTIEKPFSYVVPLNRFPQKTTVYNSDGKMVKVVNELGLNEIIPKGFMATRQGKRIMSWRLDKAASLYYVEALDGGNPANEVPFRDEIYSWDAPFTATATSIAKTPQRYGGIVWGDQNHAILMDQWYDTRNEKTYLINPNNAAQKAEVLYDLNSQDIYADPGRFQTEKNQFGKRTLAIRNGNLFLVGDGHTAKGQFPFVDELNLKTKKTKRLYQSSDKDKLESVQTIYDFDKGEILVSIESKNEFPNYFLRSYKNKKSKPLRVTNFANPFASISKVHKEVIKYKRKDGVDLSGTLYLPTDYDAKKKYPLLIWAYPAEYKDKNSAGQSSKNPNEFTFPYYGSFVYWVTQGYVVLDDAAFPIIGEGTTEPNDTFIPQLVANAEAAIDAVDKLGYIDRTKVAVGGHSYGAFMTANLLTHSNLFACGIARSGAYNRTLTPFGFQSEQRNYWEAPEIYNTMSPFMNADKMKTPMLLTHGEADNNPGTFTLQTERYFQALKGLGAPVRMVILPKESHGYAAKENILHLLWEQHEFLEKYLKN